MNKFVNAEDVKDLLNGLDSLPWEDEVEDMVDKLVVDDVAEIKHGEWIKAGIGITERVVCSICKSDKGSFMKPPFCNQCGAKMDLN